MVATARGRYEIVGSCKWHRSAGATVLGRLRRDAEALGPRAANARLVIFARGFDADLTEEATREGVRLISAAELFKDATRAAVG